jgi:hypothetical protein
MVQWKDNKAVYLASNCFAVEPMQNVTRYHAAEKGHKQVPCPRLVTEYNKHMGGVDLLDSGEKNYAITVRVKKWYWAIYTWFLNVSMVQAWRLYRIHKKQEHQLAREEDNREMEAWEERMAEREERGEEDRRRQKVKVDRERLSRDKINSEKNRERKKIEEIPLLDFIRQVVELMVVAHSTTFANPVPQSMVSARLSQPNLEVVRYDNGRHIIFKSQIHGVCKACKLRTLYRCERCEVAIHPDCFYGFHSREETED